MSLASVFRARRFVGLLPLLLLAALLFSGLLFCPAKVVFGVPCPGCGLTRATAAMLSLQFGEMLLMHPLAPLLAPLFAWVVARPVLVEIGWIDRGSRDPLQRLPSFAWVVLLIAVLALWIGRLLGFLGGHPDPIDPANGLLGQALQLSGAFQFDRALHWLASF